MKLWVVVALWLVATPSLAQINCMPNNPAMPSAGSTCYDNRPPQAGSPASLDLGSGDVFSYVHTQRERKREKVVGGLIADGKCDEAKKYALREGSLDLAERVDRLCLKADQPR